MTVATCGGCRRLRWIPTLIWVLPLYWLVIFPRTRRELRRWRERAEAIPDPVLRGHALDKLNGEHVTVEGAAAFAILAATRYRSDVIRACVAFEVLYGYVDLVGEQRVENMLAHNHAVHRAMVLALLPGADPEDHYAHYPGHDDGGYLQELIETCRSNLARLPARRVTSPALLRLATLAGETQSLNHAGQVDGHDALNRWATERPLQDASWWELAAAASSPLGIYALFAAASERRTRQATTISIEDAYFPWIGAVVWLLESLVDSRADAVSGNHSYVANYSSREEATRRLMTIATRAHGATQGLPRAPRHTILLSGGVGLYLSMQEARAPDLQHVTRAVRRTIGGPMVLMLAMLRARRFLAGALDRRASAST